MVSTSRSKRATSNRSSRRKKGYAQVGPTLLSFDKIVHTENPPMPLEVFITNDRAKALNWRLEAENANWLEMDSEYGTVEPHSQQSVKLTGLTAALKFGRYLATLHFILDELASVSVSVSVHIIELTVDRSTNHIGPKAPTVRLPGSSNALETLAITIPPGKSSATTEIVVSNPNTESEMLIDGNTEVIWNESTGDSRVTLKPASSTQGVGGTTTVTVTVSRQSQQYTARLAFRNTYPIGNFSNQPPDTLLEIDVK